MKTKFVSGLLVGSLIGVLLLLAVTTTQAAPNADTYDLSWYTISGGGVLNASAGAYSLSSTIGQASTGPLSAEPYRLGSGFWYALSPYAIFLPLLLK